MAQNIPRSIADPKKMQAALAAVSTQLEQRLKQDHSFRGEIEDLSQPLLHLRNRVDPTDHGEYFPWVVRRYLHGGIRLWEDMGRVGAALRQLHFGKATRQLTGKCSDINRLNSLSELEDLVEPLVPTSQKDLSREERARIDAETEEVYRDANLRIIIPRTEAASIFWGQGTRWCTAASTSENHFERYNDAGPLHILLINNPATGQGVKLQLHFELNEFVNSRDEPPSPDECHMLCAALRASRAPDFIRRLETEMPDDLLEYGWPQTPELCLAAVQNNAFSLEHVHDQAPELCLAAVQQNANALECIREQTLEICLAAVQNNAYALEHVREQTPEICMAAVQQKGLALRYVREQTPEICLAAVQQCGFAIRYVQEQTPEICLAAMQEFGYALEHVHEQTPEICLAAVQQNAFELKHVREQTPEICLAAVQQNALALKHVREQTPEICLAAVQQNALVQGLIDERYRAHCRDFLDRVISEDQALDRMRGPVAPALGNPL